MEGTKGCEGCVSFHGSLQQQVQYNEAIEAVLEMKAFSPLLPSIEASSRENVPVS